MNRYFGLDSDNNRTCVADVALVVGVIVDVVSRPRPMSRLTELFIRSDAGERKKIVLNTEIFGDMHPAEMLGVRAMCAVHNVQDFDSAPTHHDVYKDHQVLCILDGARAGTLLEYKDRRQP